MTFHKSRPSTEPWETSANLHPYKCLQDVIQSDWRHSSCTAKFFASHFSVIKKLQQQLHSVSESSLHDKLLDSPNILVCQRTIFLSTYHWINHWIIRWFVLFWTEELTISTGTKNYLFQFVNSMLKNLGGLLSIVLFTGMFIIASNSCVMIKKFILYMSAAWIPYKHR